MTLTGLNGHFTLYVHYCELPLTHYLLLIYCRLFITRDVTSREVREAEYSKTVIRRAADYLEFVENLADLPFRGRYIVGTLTNNAMQH